MIFFSCNGLYFWSLGGPLTLPSPYSRTAGPEFDKSSKKFSFRAFAILQTGRIVYATSENRKDASLTPRSLLSESAAALQLSNQRRFADESDFLANSKGATVAG